MSALAFLCIDTKTYRVRRYIRGRYRPVHCTDEFEIIRPQSETLPSELELLRRRFPGMKVDPPPEPEVA